MYPRRARVPKLLVPLAVIGLGALVAACGSTTAKTAGAGTAAPAGGSSSSPTTSDPAASDLAAAKQAAEKAIANGGGGDGGQGGPGSGDGGQGRGGAGFGGPFGDAIDIAAKDLGVTVGDLNTAMQGGQTIAQLAQSKGVDLNKVIDDMVAGVKEHYDADVASGEHTQAEADQVMAQAKAQVTDMVNGKTPVGGPPPGGGRGPRPNGTASSTTTTTTA
jgi:hypothetical protein